MKLGEFFMDLVVNAGSGELTVKNLITKMGELEAATIGEIGVLYEMGVRLASITDQAVKTSLGLQSFTSITGESTIKLQSWRAAAEMVNVSAETVDSTFTNLAKGIEDMRWGEATGVLKGAVQVLGIDPTGKDVFQVMDSISAKLKEKYGNDQAAKVHVLGMMGMDPNMIRLLDKTEAQRRKMAEGAHILSRREQADFIEIEHEMIRINREVGKFGIELASWASPGLLTALHSALDLSKQMAHYAKLSVEGWQLLLKLTGNKSVGELLDKGERGLDDLKKSGEQTGWQSVLARALYTIFNPMGVAKEHMAVGPNSINAMLDKTLTSGDTGSRTPISKTNNNTFNFNGMDGDEARKAVRGISEDQNDDTELQLNSGRETFTATP